ncbi:MAG: hypothetical protein RQ758_02560 [Methanomicrobiaceae archaeon]|nr:hypothetical protein [Methanomicrobiaceae archaeon]
MSTNQMHHAILIRWAESERSKACYEEYMRGKLGIPPIEDLIRERIPPRSVHPTLQKINQNIPFCS